MGNQPGQLDSRDDDLGPQMAGPAPSSVPRQAEDRGPATGTKQEAAQANAQGVELLKNGQHKDAILEFQAALRYEPGSVQILNNIGLAYAKLQDFDQAYKWYEKAYRQDTQDIETLFSLAWVERKRQQFVHAKELFHKVLDVQPDHVKALYLLGDIHKSSHDYASAVRCFEKLVSLDQNNIDGNISLAQCYESLKDYKMSSKLYKTILHIDPKRTDVMFFLGRTYFHWKQNASAVYYFDLVPDADPHAFEARTYAAKSCREMEDFPKAIQYAESAAQIRPHADVLFFLGEEYLRKGDQHSASHWFHRALETEPSHTQSLMELGKLMYKQSRWEEADRRFTKLLEADPLSISTLQYSALVKYKLRENFQCKRICFTLLKNQPLNSEALWILAEMQRTEPGSTDNRNWYLSLQFPKDISHADVCLAIAKTYLNRQQTKEGQVWLREFQQYKPTESRVNEAISRLAGPCSGPGLQEVLRLIEQVEQVPSDYSSATRSTSMLGTGLQSTQASTFSPSQPREPSPPVIRPKEPSPRDQRLTSQEGAEDTLELERLVRTAEKSPSREPWREVIRFARTILSRRSNDAVALKYLARAYLARDGDVSEVREYATRALRESSDVSGFTLGFELHTYLARSYQSEKDWEQVERHFNAALSSRPGDEEAMLGLARALHQQRKDSKKTQRVFEQVVAVNPASLESHVKLAEICADRGDFTEAYRWASKAATISSVDFDCLVVLGRTCAKLQKNSEAVQAYEKALGLQPKDIDVMVALGSLRRKMGKDQDALLLFKRALEAHPGHYECYINLAQLHAAEGTVSTNQSLHYFRSALGCRPAPEEKRAILIQMAMVHIAATNYQDAREMLENVVRDSPEDREAWQRLLAVYEKQQFSEGQLRCCRRLIQFDGGNVSLHLTYGQLLESQNPPQMREAREQFEQALKLQPRNTEALLKLGNNARSDHHLDRNLDVARRWYDQLLQFDANNIEALDGAAYCSRKLNDHDQAIRLYQTVLNIRPSSESALYYLGDILYKQFRHTECQQYLTKLVEGNCSPDYKTGALYLLSKSHVSLDEYEEAERRCLMGLDLKPHHPHFMFILALVRNRVADYDRSISILQEALKHCDTHEDAKGATSEQLKVEIYDWLAQAYERKRDYNNARLEYEKALTKDPNHVSSLITKGVVHMQLKQLDQAEDAFKKALAHEKNHAMALVRLGYCKLLASNYDDALPLFQKAIQQRCGTVALPRSVKGSARVYMALALMGQSDMDGAMFHLAEARKSHRNFNHVYQGARDAIVKGDVESLVNKLRAICDLDVNTAQAWQLVRLTAKELEVDIQHSPRGDALRRSSGALGNGRQRPLPGSSLVAQQRPNQFNPAPRTSGANPGAPATAQPSQRANPSPQPSQRRQWQVEPPRADDQRRWVPPSSTAGPPSSQYSMPSSQQTTARPSPPQQPSLPSTALSSAKAMDSGTLKPGECIPGPGNLQLSLSEQIDPSELQQGECLGTGGFGAVYRGFFQGREVAIKKLFIEDGGSINPLQLEELEKEVSALRALKHPRLVTFIGASLQPPHLCIVTEYMSGGSLHNLLHRVKTKLTFSQQMKLALQMSEGVSFLHNLRPPVVHRDLKSLNIILDRQLNSKICDFGLTQSMEKTHISLKEGGNGGSPRYMAPECYDCKGKITEKVDVWAMGCILIEIFGGPLPYDDCTNIQQIVAKVLIDKQPPFCPTTIPQGVRSIIESCLIFDITSRTTSGEVYNGLQRVRAT